MEGQEVLFVLFGIKWTLPLLITAFGGTLGAALTLYKLVERWLTRTTRRLDMLREYLDKEEKDITGRKSSVLATIQVSEHSFRADKKFDVGAEIDRAIELLDRGYPQLATGKLSELEKRLEANEEILRKRADDLKKHTASVHIFLAALADRDNKADLGLDYIDKALGHDQSDLDALKYKSVLLLHKGDLDNAERSYDRLRQRSIGRENSAYRADAHLGLGTIKYKRGVEFYDAALQSLNTALTNIGSVPSAEQNHFTFSQIYLLQADIYSSSTWAGADRTKALENYRKAKNSLAQLSKKRETTQSKIKDIESKIEGLQQLDRNP